jgi:hypothetical protein
MIARHIHVGSLLCRFAKGGRGWASPSTGSKQDAQAFREEVRTRRLKKKTEQRKQRSSARGQRPRSQPAEEPGRRKPGRATAVKSGRAAPAKGGVRKPAPKGRPAGRRKR